MWVGLAQSMPNLECVFWTMAFVSFLQSSRQNKPKQQVVAHLDELLTTPSPREWAHVVEEANKGFRTRKGRWDA